MVYSRVGLLRRTVVGAVLGIGCAVLIQVLWLLLRVGNDFGIEDGPQAWVIPLSYVLGLLLSGAIAGWIVSGASTLAGAALCGIVAVQPFVAMVILSSRGGTGLSLADAFAAWCGMTLLLGPLLGSAARIDLGTTRRLRESGATTTDASPQFGHSPGGVGR